MPKECACPPTTVEQVEHSRCGRKAPVPLVVFEIVLGIPAGPDVLGWAHDDTSVRELSQFGSAMLFFMAGYEIDFARLRGGPLNRALLGAFSAGVIMRIPFHSGTPERTERITAKLEAIGFGFLIPAFFIQTGIGYDLKALTSNWAMVGASMLSVLLYPFLALKVSGAARTPQGREEAAESW